MTEHGDPRTLDNPPESYIGLRADPYAKEIVRRTGSESNSLVEASIRRLARLIYTGGQVDIVVRKDGKEWHFEADWLKRLFREPRA